MKTSASYFACVIVTFAVFGLLCDSLQAQKRVDFRQELACNTLTPASMGGSSPKNPNLPVYRWLGAANVEVDYRDNIILVDAYYNMPPADPLGFTRDDISARPVRFLGNIDSTGWRISAKGLREALPSKRNTIRMHWDERAGTEGAKRRRQSLKEDWN